MLNAQLNVQGVEKVVVDHHHFPTEEDRHEFHTIKLNFGDVIVNLFIAPEHIATVLAQLQEVSHHVEN